jgi:hypothetical protein
MGLAGFARAESPLPSPSDWWVLLEPKFMKPAVGMAIPGATRTVLAPGYTEGLDLEPMSAEQFEKLALAWKDFAGRASGNAAQFLETLKPEFTRDSEGVIQFATLSSDRPLVASTALAPEFRAVFEKTLGPEFLVVIPNRYLIYAFPKLASRYREYGPMVIDAYDATPYPVSLEVFEVTREGLRGIGVYERP